MNQTAVLEILVDTFVWGLCFAAPTVRVPFLLFLAVTLLNHHILIWANVAVGIWLVDTIVRQWLVLLLNGDHFD